MAENSTYDLLLRGGHVICPASGLNAVMDVAIRDGKIAAVRPDILPTAAKEVLDVRGRLVLPGMIDTHAHDYNCSAAVAACMPTWWACMPASPPSSTRVAPPA